MVHFRDYVNTQTTVVLSMSRIRHLEKFLVYVVDNLLS